MLNKPLTLTIVIPAYNEQSYLAACLDSIAAQTVMPGEVIVVNNNSTDSTVAIAREYLFVTVINEARQGVFFASRAGFNRASSDIIGRIDADTILPSDWVEKVLPYFKDPETAAVTGPVNYYDMPLPKQNHWFDHAMRLFTYRWTQATPFLYGSNYAIRNQDWRRVVKKLCIHSDIHEDVDLAIHLTSRRRSIIYTKRILSNASARRYNDSPKRFLAYVAMYQRVYKRHDMRTLAVYPGIFMWCLGYLLIHPCRNLWYSIYGRVNDIYPISRGSRKNPMSGTIEI